MQIVMQYMCFDFIVKIIIGYEDNEINDNLTIKESQLGTFCP